MPDHEARSAHSSFIVLAARLLEGSAERSAARLGSRRSDGDASRSGSRRPHPHADGEGRRSRAAGPDRAHARHPRRAARRSIARRRSRPSAEAQLRLVQAGARVEDVRQAQSQIETARAEVGGREIRARRRRAGSGPLRHAAQEQLRIAQATRRCGDAAGCGERSRGADREPREDRGRSAREAQRRRPAGGNRRGARPRQRRQPRRSHRSKKDSPTRPCNRRSPASSPRSSSKSAK